MSFVTNSILEAGLDYLGTSFPTKYISEKESFQYLA